MGARPHLARRMDRADARRLALRAVRAHACSSPPTGVEVLTLLPGEPLELPLRDSARAGSLPLERRSAACDWRGNGARHRLDVRASGARSRCGSRAEGAAVCRDRPRPRRAATRSSPTIEADGGRGRFVPAELRRRAGVRRARRRRAADALGGLTVLVNNAAGGDAADGPVGDAHDRRVGGDPRASNLTAPMWLHPRRDPAHASRRARRDRQHLDAGRPSAASRGLRGVHREQRRASTALTRVDRGRLRRPTASAATRSAPATCSTTAATPTSTPERRARYEGMHLTRLGVADDVAYAAVYLASRESEFVTGINLQLDGGSSIARGLTLG